MNQSDYEAQRRALEEAARQEAARRALEEAARQETALAAQREREQLAQTSYHDPKSGYRYVPGKGFTNSTSG